MKLVFNPPNHVDIWNSEQRKSRNVEVNSLDDILAIPWLQKNLQDPDFEQIVYVKFDAYPGGTDLYQLFVRYKGADEKFQHVRIYNCDGDPSIFGIKNKNEI